AAAQAIDFRQQRAAGRGTGDRGTRRRGDAETDRAGRAASPRLPLSASPRPLRLGRGTAPAYALVREQIPFLEQDTVMYPLIEAARDLVAGGELVRVCEEALSAGERNA